MIFSLLGFPKQLDVLLITIFGTVFLVFDMSLFRVKEDLVEVWAYEFESQFHKYNVDIYFKYLLSGVILVRAFTLHIFLAFYIVMLWPAIFEDQPSLLLPWLTVGFIRYILVNIITLTLGSYVCLNQRGYHRVCLEFALSQLIEHGPPAYSWFVVHSYYEEVELLCERMQKQKRKPDISQYSIDSYQPTRTRRRKTVELPEINFSEKKHSGILLKSYLSESTLHNLLHELEIEAGTQKSSSRSLDSLLKSKLDNDISHSNSTDYQFKNQSIPEMVMELLNLTIEDIDQVKLELCRKLAENGENMEEKIIRSEIFEDLVDTRRDKENLTEAKKESGSPLVTASKCEHNKRTVEKICKCGRTQPPIQSSEKNT